MAFSATLDFLPILVNRKSNQKKFIIEKFTEIRSLRNSSILPAFQSKMTVKRLRVTRSSSNLLAESSTAPESSRSCRDARPRGKAMRVSQPENKAILQVSATEENASGEKKKEKFFEKCYNCEKKIGEADAVFMYSYLRAFCCEDCRDDQIEQDRTFGSWP